MSDKKKTAKMDEILGRALRDKEFRQKLIDDPKGVAKEGELSEEDLDLVAGGFALGTTLAATSLSSRFNPGQVAFCTSRICNEGSARPVGDIAVNPAIATNIAKKTSG